MSLPLVILSSIAVMLEAAEATPLLWVDLNKRAAADLEARAEKEFSNASTTTTDKKATTTTKRATTTRRETKTDATSAHATSAHAASAHATSAHTASAHATSTHTTSDVSSVIPSTSTSASTSASTSDPSSASASASASAAATSTSVTPMLIPAGTNTTSASSSVISPTTSALADTSSGSGVSGGAIGGIVAAIVIIVLGAAAYFFVRRKKNSTSRGRHLSTKPDPFTMGYGSDQAFTPQPMQQQQNYQHQYGVQPASPTHYNNNTQFQDANMAESMAPAAVPAQQYQAQPQEYQPQLNEEYSNEHIEPLAPIAAVAVVAAAGVGGTLLPPTQAGSVGVFHVAATYTPTLSDEIDIQTGDQVEVLVEYDDGWCQGINLSRGNAKGVFPKHCIDYASGVSSSGGNIDRSKRVSSMYIG